MARGDAIDVAHEEVNVVEGVEELGAEFHVHVLPYGNLLHRSQVSSEESRLPEEYSRAQLARGGNRCNVPSGRPAVGLASRNGAVYAESLQRVLDHVRGQECDAAPSRI